MEAITVSTQTEDQLFKTYADLVNITRNAEQERTYQVVKFELEKRLVL